MVKSGSAIKPEIQIGLQLDVTAVLKKKRDLSTSNLDYQAGLKKANETLSKALKIAEQDPEGGLAILKHSQRPDSRRQYLTSGSDRGIICVYGGVWPCVQIS
jgi:hypothetical protein